MSPSCIVYRVSYERATVSVFLSVCYSNTQNSITLIRQRDTDSGRQVAVGTEWIGNSVKCDNRQPAGPGCCTFDSNGETGFHCVEQAHTVVIPPPRWIHEPSVVRDRDGRPQDDPLTVHCASRSLQWSEVGMEDPKTTIWQCTVHPGAFSGQR